MTSPLRSVFRALADEHLLIPHLRNALLSDTWPDSYTVEVDSSPYYGAGDGCFHPSTHPLLPERLLYYMFHPDHRDRLITEPRDVQSHMTLAMGSALHAVIQTQFVMAGMITEEDIEVDYFIEEHNVRGRIDFVVHHPNGQTYVVEFKTVNNRKFDLTTEVRPEWDAQLSLALHATGHPVGILLALESGFPYRMKEFRVPRNDELLSEVFGKFDRVREAIALNRPPGGCCTPGSPAMKSCPARFECWPGLAEKGRL